MSLRGISLRSRLLVPHSNNNLFNRLLFFQQKTARSITTNFNQVSKPTLTESIPDSTPGLLEKLVVTSVEADHFLLQSIKSVEYLDIPWWVVIGLGTFLVRATTTLPITLYQQWTIAKIQSIRPILEAWAGTYKRKFGLAPKIDPTEILFFQRGLNHEYKRKVKQLYKERGYHPWVTYLIPVVQLPVFLLLSVTNRAMSGHGLFDWDSLKRFYEPEFIQGGYSWFTNLTLADPTLILPLCVGAINLINIELNPAFVNIHNKGIMQRILPNIGRGMALSSIVIASYAPASLAIYWTFSSSFSLIQNFLLRNNIVRRRIGLPLLPAVS